jgi:hypothetical protein
MSMRQNNGVSTNMGIVYVAPVQNKAGIHFMVNLSHHEVQPDNVYSTWNMFAAPLITDIMMEP